MPTLSFDETFSSQTLDPHLRWHCEPAHWRIDAASNALVVQPNANTDFWQRTHYGFEADNGHFLYCETEGDFVLTTQVAFEAKHQYDQAGLMVRISPSCWLKTSIEFEPHEENRLGAVVTNAQYSDWSTQPIAKAVQALWLRVRAEGADYVVESSLDGARWTQLRMARLHERAAVTSVQCGLYACSPKEAGYRAVFSSFSLRAGRVQA
jgi:uncharacterized protein